MRVHDLSPAPGSRKAAHRVGRGIGGKGGKTAGRGTKGQRARSSVAAGFEGGQMPLKQRVPKLKGFNNPFRVEYHGINLDTIEALDETTIDPQSLAAHGLVRKGDFVKILGPWRAHQEGRRARARRVEGRRSGDHQRRRHGDDHPAPVQERSPPGAGQPVRQPLTIDCRS